MDIGTLIGMLLAFGLIVGSIFLGGSLKAFFDIPSVLIVVFGTIAVTFIMFPMSMVFGSIKIMLKAFFAKPSDPKEMIKTIVGLADIARKARLVALEKAPVDDPFLKKGVLMAADGTEEETIRSVMEVEIAFMKQRHAMGQEIFNSMGTMSPAFGMIGTLIGLVNMLQNLDDPTSIGPAMAVALLTTFYGAVLANVVFLPIAKKLEVRSAEEILFMEIAVEGILSIVRGENPRIIKEKLESFLAPALRKVEE